MSLEKDITAIKGLVEQSIFAPATPEEVTQRRKLGVVQDAVQWLYDHEIDGGVRDFTSLLGQLDTAIAVEYVEKLTQSEKAVVVRTVMAMFQERA